MNMIGHYRLLGTLGRGGMGVVYKGHETSLNRYVAIKVLAESLSNDESVKERFLREARSMAALNDPHIISIYFIGDDAGQTYFVMEFVDGESLGSLLKREGKLKPEQAAKIIYQTALGLSTAHDKGVIHRDIKPGNLMLTAKGAVKIADFGIALSTQDFSKKLTSTGEFVGTPGYLSPEVCQGKPVDQRSDIFSLGIVLFECLAGRMPFTDESPLGLMLEVVKAEIPDVRTLNAEVDPELERILSKMVAKDPADRYQSCQDLVADLGRHPAIVASGATLSLPVQAAPVERPRATRTTNVHPLAPATDATFSTEPPTSQRLAASRPLLRQPALRPLPSHGKRNAAIAATALLAIAAGAWAFRGDLSLAPTPADNAPSLASVTTPSPLAGAPEVARSSASTVYDDYVPVDAQAPRASPTAANDAADPALLDDEWLGDVPDAAFDADGYDYASAAYSAAPGSPPPPYAPVVYYPPYAVPVVPVAYYAPSPWRFGFGMTLGFGTGWWTTRYYAPVYFGPVVSPIAVAPRPLPGTVASANPAVATATPANRPLPSTSAPSAPSRSAATRTPVGAQSARSEAPERALAKNNVQALQGQQLARREQRMAQMQQARRERMQAQAEQQRQARREMQVEERREAQAKRQQAAERAGHPHPHPRPKEHRY